MIFMKCNLSLNIFIYMAFSILFFSSCEKEKISQTNTEAGKIVFKFNQTYNNQPIIYDSLIYINAAGNKLMINQIQYFISDVTLHKSGGGLKILNSKEFCHYIDKDILSTLTWSPADVIATGAYDSISFTFGISKEKNKTGLFVNPPENNMSWPEMLGGGYHYMKMNLKFQDTTNYLAPFNFHLGIGQIYNSKDSIIGFVQNYFNVTLPNSTFVIENGKTKEIQIIMNVESWFKTPHVFDFNQWEMPGMMGIMQNETGMKAACNNGFDVFTIGYIK